MPLNNPHFDLSCLPELDLSELQMNNNNSTSAIVWYNNIDLESDLLQPDLVAKHSEALLLLQCKSATKAVAMILTLLFQEAAATNHIVAMIYFCVSKDYRLLLKTIHFNYPRREVGTMALIFAISLDSPDMVHFCLDKLKVVVTDAYVSASIRRQSLHVLRLLLRFQQSRVVLQNLYFSIEAAGAKHSNNIRSVEIFQFLWDLAFDPDEEPCSEGEMVEILYNAIHHQADCIVSHLSRCFPIKKQVEVWYRNCEQTNPIYALEKKKIIDEYMADF